MSLLAVVVAASCGPKSAFSRMYVLALYVLRGQCCPFLGTFVTGRPMPSHICRLCSVLSSLGLSTPVFVLISLPRIIFVEISLLEVKAVVPAKMSGTILKLFLLLVSSLLVLLINRAICPSSTGSVRQEPICSKAPMENRTCAPDFPYLWLILKSKASSASRVQARCNESRKCPPS